MGKGGFADGAGRGIDGPGGGVVGEEELAALFADGKAAEDFFGRR